MLLLVISLQLIPDLIVVEGNSRGELHALVHIFSVQRLGGFVCEEIVVTGVGAVLGVLVRDNPVLLGKTLGVLCQSHIQEVLNIRICNVAEFEVLR